MKDIKFGDRVIGDDMPVFVIAEAGVNHNGSLKLAKRLIDAAHSAGADAVKFQSFKAERIITRSAPSAQYHLRATKGKETWYKLLKRLEISDSRHYELLDYCKKKGIYFLSTPYDEESAEFLRRMPVLAFKIASTDLNNLPLLRLVASYNKPIFLATGMSSIDEIRESVECVRGAGNGQLVLFQCTANYPPAIADANLNVISALRERFNTLVGYSDHLASRQAAIAAVAKGICAYEVHFTEDRGLPGPDHRASLEYSGLRRIIRDIRMTQLLLGSARKRVTPSESQTRIVARKSLVASRNIKEGEALGRHNLGIKRPGTGLPPKYFYFLLGKRINRAVKKDELILLKDVKGNGRKEA